MDDPGPRAQRREALIAHVLSATLELLGRLPPSARTRELGARARGYDLMTKRWETVPPSEPQLDAMLDLVTELYADAMDVPVGPENGDS